MSLRAVNLQAFIAIAVAGLSYFFVRDGSAALAVLYGGATALTNSLLLQWRKWQAERNPPRDARYYLRRFRRSSVERLLVVAILLALGMGSFGLIPLGVLAGFVLGQLALIISQYIVR